MIIRAIAGICVVAIISLAIGMGIGAAVAERNYYRQTHQDVPVQPVPTTPQISEKFVEVQIMYVHYHDPNHWYTDSFNYTILERVDNKYRFRMNNASCGKEGDTFSMKSSDIP